MSEKLDEMRARLRRKQYYIIEMTPVEDWDNPLEHLKPRLAEHLDFLKRLEAEGILFLSGPFRGPDGDWKGDGMSIIRADSLASAREIFADEPFAEAGIRTNRIRPWQVNEGSISLTARLFSSEIEIA